MIRVNKIKDKQFIWTLLERVQFGYKGVQLIRKVCSWIENYSTSSATSNTSLDLHTVHDLQFKTDFSWFGITI